MQIHIDTNDLSSDDVKVLAAIVAALGGETPVLPTVKAQPVDDPNEGPEEKPKRTRRTKAQIEADKLAAEQEVAEGEAEDGGDEPESEDSDEDGDGAPTMKEAVALATKLVGDGRAAEVKEALAEVGAKKVSELKKAADIATFITALS